MHQKIQKGFILTELLVAIAIISVVIIAIHSVFERHNKIAAIQEEHTRMYQELLTASQWISEGLRMCGYSDKGTRNFGFSHRNGTGAPDYGRWTDATSVYCTQDWNNDGTINESGTGSSFEHIGFRLNVSNNGSPKPVPDNVLRRYDTGIIHWQPLCPNITDLKFTYKDREGAIIATPETHTDQIYSVGVTITASPSPEKQGLHISNRTMTTEIFCRNIPE